jgi:DNA-binding transcriptional MerR regulator
MATRLVGSGEAAKAVGVHVRTLQEWAKAGIVKPTTRTAGGYARWDIDDLRRQLEELNEQQRGTSEDE